MDELFGLWKLELNGMVGSGSSACQVVSFDGESALVCSGSQAGLSN